MKFKKSDIQHISKLARLKLSDDELKVYMEQLNSIVDYVEKLHDIDTQGIKPFEHVGETTNVTRDDEVKGCVGDDCDRLIKNFPDSQGDSLKVPKVL